MGQWASSFGGRVIAAEPADFSARGTRVELGALKLAMVQVTPISFAWSAGAPDVVDAFYLVTGSARVASGGRTRVLEPGALVFSRPVSGDTRVIDSTSTFIRVIIPAEMIGTRLRRIDAMPLIAVDPTFVGPVIGLIRAVILDSEANTGRTVAALERAVLGLLEGLLTDSIRKGVGGAVGQHDSLLTQALAFVKESSADYRLSADGVAATLGVSRRSLDLAFEKDSASVSSAIRSARLVEVDRALLEGRLDSDGDLARAHGFTSAERLRRAVQKEHGMTLTQRRDELRARRVIGDSASDPAGNP